MNRGKEIEARELIDACAHALGEVIEVMGKSGHLIMDDQIVILDSTIKATKYLQKIREEVEEWIHTIADIITYPPLREHLETQESRRKKVQSCPSYISDLEGCLYSCTGWPRRCAYLDTGECPYGFEITLPGPVAEGKGSKR